MQPKSRFLLQTGRHPWPCVSPPSGVCWNDLDIIEAFHVSSLDFFKIVLKMAKKKSQNRKLGWFYFEKQWCQVKASIKAVEFYSKWDSGDNSEESGERKGELCQVCAEALTVPCGPDMPLQIIVIGKKLFVSQFRRTSLILLWTVGLFLYRHTYFLQNLESCKCTLKTSWKIDLEAFFLEDINRLSKMAK